MKAFEVCVRAVIRRENKILVCRRKDKDYYFFPGGHVEFGESAQKALVRELKEELDLPVQKVSFIGSMENVFNEDYKKKHEFNLVFDVQARDVRDKSAEDHLEFHFFDLKRLAKERVLPIDLRDQVLKWLGDKKIFWVSKT